MRNLFYLAGTIVCVLSVLASRDAFCQTSSPNSSFTIQGPAERAMGEKVALDAYGKPCLDSEAAARAHVVNPNVIDHVVSIKNGCPKTIKASICYLNSDRCNEVQLPAYGRVDTVIGTTVGLREFRYRVIQR
jgi:hypothetical protein